MLKYLRTIGVTTLVAVIAVVGIGSLALAWPAAAAEPEAVTAHGGGGRGLCGTAGKEAAAAALGLTTDELSTQLRAGESLSDLAEAAGVELETVQAAINDACVEANRAAIEQAVTDGTLTREHADWLLEGLDKGFWGTGAGKGDFGFGPHGFGGSKGTPRSTPAPSTDTSTGGA